MIFLLFSLGITFCILLFHEHRTNPLGWMVAVMPPSLSSILSSVTAKGVMVVGEVDNALYLATRHIAISGGEIALRFFLGNASLTKSPSHRQHGVMTFTLHKVLRSLLRPMLIKSRNDSIISEQFVPKVMQEVGSPDVELLRYHVIRATDCYSLVLSRL